MLLLAITVLGTMAVNSSSAQYNARHERADIYNDRVRLERLNHERHLAAYYGDRRAYRRDAREERRAERDIRHDRREIRDDRRYGRGGRY